MLNRLFGKRAPEADPAQFVRADPDFDVEHGHLIARAVKISWFENGAERTLTLRRNLRPAQPVVTRNADGGFGLCLQKNGEPDKVLATGLDYPTAADLHRVVWNWLGQLCQNGHDPFPIKLTPPEHGFPHSDWPEAQT